MKKLICAIMVVLMIGAMLQGCGSKDTSADYPPSSEISGTDGITAEMAFEGVNNYCHTHYDWSIAEKNPDIMYVRMGEESDTAYQVIFRSYTGAFVYFTDERGCSEPRCGKRRGGIFFIRLSQAERLILKKGCFDSFFIGRRQSFFYSVCFIETVRAVPAIITTSATA